MSDTSTTFSKDHAWLAGTERTGRYAILIEKDGTISYSDVDSQPGNVEVCNTPGADASLYLLGISQQAIGSLTRFFTEICRRLRPAKALRICN